MGCMTRARVLIAPTVAMGHMISVDRCYCGTRGTRVDATSAHNSDGPSDISGLLLLPPTMATGRCYYHLQ
jgi:hypothetical protein